MASAESATGIRMDFVKRWREQEVEDLLALQDDFEKGNFTLSISEKLSWELVAQNDRGDYSLAQRTALEIAYGVALANDSAESYKATMESVASQVSNPEIKRLLQMWTRRGLQ